MFGDMCRGRNATRARDANALMRGIFTEHHLFKRPYIGFNLPLFPMAEIQPNLILISSFIRTESYTGQEFQQIILIKTR